MSATGREFTAIWKHGTWVMEHVDEYEAELVEQDRNSKLVLIHQKT